MGYGAIMGQNFGKDIFISVSDDVAELFSLPKGASLHDVLLSIGFANIEGTVVKVKVTVGGKPAKAGILINGLTSLAGGQCVTDSSGQCIGVASQTEGTFNISTPPYEDIPSVSQNVNASPNVVQEATLALNAPQANSGDYVTQTTNKDVWFSPYVTGVDVHVIDGGNNGQRGGGTGGTEGYARSGRGGDGGKQGYQLNITNFNTLTTNSLQVATKGSGGTSTFLGVTGTMIAGTGGTGGIALYQYYDGGLSVQNVEPGNNNTIKLFGSGSIVGSGGGGGGKVGVYRGTTPSIYEEQNGGQIGGGKGGTTTGSGTGTEAEPGQDGQAPGAGGGGGSAYLSYQQLSTGGRVTTAIGGKGAAGAVYYRWRVESV